jgi:2-polyprenyl-6-methoxyphenol hydroxylase-like FAD-dependent oxidoreductase
MSGDNLEIITGAKVTNVDTTSGIVTLENGSTLQGDVVLGADGVKSVCRTTVVPSKGTVSRIQIFHDNPRLIDFSLALQLVTAAYAYRFQLDAGLFAKDQRLAPLMKRHSMYSTGPYRMVVYPIRKATIANVVILCPPSLFSAQEIGWSIRE